MAFTIRSPKISDDKSRDEGDRFSNLPEHLILYIFSFLETIDVIRASAVSRQWRYLWTSMPYLTFNLESVWSQPLEKWNIRTIIEKFKDLVNWVFLSQDPSVDIQRFRLCCFYDESDFTLHRWITILSQRNVKELDLELTQRGAGFPRTLLSCESLVTLKLQGRHSVLKLPSVVGFMRLVSLDLKEIEFNNSKLFQNFISSCPLLENLTMFACIFRDFGVLDISTTSLKKLTIDNDGSSSVHGDGLSACELKIVCPRLVAFNYLGPLTKDFSFQHANSLKDAFIAIEYYFDPVPENRECQRCIIKILEGVRNTRSLKLSLRCLEFLYPSLGKPVVPFLNLKCLKVTSILEDSLQSIINLLNCSPNLEALAIHFEWYEFNDCWEMLDEAIECLTCHLKVVELIEFGGHENELELIRFLLQNGHVLKKVDIYYCPVKNSNKIISEVMKFPRSSKEVAISFFRQE